MAVSVDDVKKAARLAKIRLEDSKIEKLRDDLNSILHFVEQLSAVECLNGDDDLRLATAAMPERADVATPCDSKALLDNAPQKECNMFVVPKVVG